MRVALFVLAMGLAAPAPPAAADQAAWEQWQHIVGVVDVGARADGSLVVMANGHLYQIPRGGQTANAFANGNDGFSASADAESYFVLTPALSVDAAGCAWTADDLYVLDLNAAPGVDRVDPAGHSTHFASVANVDTLGGIALDTTGTFGNRLLVTGAHQNRTTVAAIDCRGTVTTITDAAPPLEGGLAVAPSSFGQFGGQLIAPDENTGQVWAIDPAGTATLVIVPNLPTGGDTGVESIGFVPPGFSAGGFAYLADRGTADNPFPGTDSLLRLSSAALAGAGVADSDLLVATEGGGTTVAIHCAATCTAIQAAAGTNGGHIEGHITLVTAQTAS